MKKLTALTLTLAVSLLAAGCSSDKEEGAPSSETSQEQGTQTGGTAEGFSAAPEGTDTGSWDSEKYPERVGTSSKEFLLSTEYGVWEAGKAWYVTGGTWEPGAAIELSISTAPEGTIDAGSLENFTSEEAGAPFTVTAGDDGTFSVAVNVPADTAPGNYVITAADSKSETEQGQIFQVVAPQ